MKPPSTLYSPDRNEKKWKKGKTNLKKFIW